VFPDNSQEIRINGGYEFQYRIVKDSSMKAIYPKSSEGAPEFPVAFPNTWIRLQRVRNEFTGYYSSDGRTWKVFTTYALSCIKKSIWDWLLLLIIRTIPHLQSSGI